MAMGEELAIAAASEVAKKATESVYDFVQRSLSYVFKYRRYLDDLKNQVQDLGYARERVEHQVDAAKRRGEEVEKDVEQWLKKVNEFTEGVVKPINDDEDTAKKRCFIRLCPNLIKRHMLSKKAAKAAQDSIHLSRKGKFSSVSFRPALQRTESVYVRGYQAFDSRMAVLLEVLETLKDVKVNVIGVYGMGGVGKTTLVKKVAWEAKENKLFDEVVIAEITQTPDYKKIQQKIAFDLGMEVEQESEYERLALLRNRLKKQKNVLVILDDVWTNLDLDAIGIPLGDAERERNDDKTRRCTILLTSRNQDVLSKDMNTQKNIHVPPLSDEDSWNLFGQIVGDLAEKSDFQPIATEIVKKCAGLPVAISAIANALRNESLYAWEDALTQLKKSNPRCTPGMKDTLYSTIELSYNFLKNDEAQLLFLLCGLYAEGTNIFIDYLLRYAYGWGLFQNVDTLEEGRNRLHSLIDHLKAACLLLDGDSEDQVKMHDIIHAVAVSIASTKFMFNIQNATGLEKKISKKSTAISLPHADFSDELPKRLECLELMLFWLFTRNQSLQIPDLFFEGMKEIKVLDLTGIHFLSLPPSLCCLKNIRTLCLDGCMLGDVAIIGELNTLEILSFLDSDIEQLPSEIGKLTRLKLLDLSNCLKLKFIAPNVISSLSRLEELYMGNSFVLWEADGASGQGRRRNASLGELKRLSNLRALHLHIQDAQIMPHDMFFEKLNSYKIFIGDKWSWSSKYDISTSRTLKLKINANNYLGHGVITLLKRVEDLYLDEINGVRNVLYELHEDGFPHLKHLQVQDGLELLYIVNSFSGKRAFPKLEFLIIHNLINLEKICHGQLDTRSFSKLRIIKIGKCDRMKYLFESFMAKNLTQLQEIEVSDCKVLEEIFGEESKDHGVEIERNSKIEFSHLCSLALKCLPQFINFGFGTKVVLPRLENLKLSSINIENIWLEQPPAMSSFSKSLTSLNVEECNGLNFLFSPSMVNSLMQLQKLVIGNCKSMESVIRTDRLGEVKISDMKFPKLIYLKLEGLPKLTKFGTGNLIEFPSLNELLIQRCSDLKTFFSNSSSVDTLRKGLEEVSLENINPLFDEKVAFPSLEKMILLHLDNLQLLWHNQLHTDSFCKLKVARVEFCEKLMTIIPSNTEGLLTFQNLESLTVTNCWSMKSLFPVSMAASLMQLKELRIYACGLEEIVAKEEVNNTPRSLFPQLTFLHLEYIPELKGFYMGMHSMEWPMLKYLMVYGCEKIKVYASELLTFRKSDGESQPHLFSFEQVIPKLETLGLNSNDITSICLDSIPSRSLWKLKELGLQNFADDSIAFQFGFLKRLYNLETLCLYDCSFNELFQYEGYLWKQDSHVDTFLQNLQTLRVLRCHCLTYLMPSSAMSFENLKNLDVSYCDGLETILSCSKAKSLVQLTTMRVRECKLLTEVITNEASRKGEEIVFSQLKILELHHLSSLTCFCSTNNAVKFPCLEEVIVSQCPKLKIFSLGVLRTPMLKRVQLTNENDQEYFWKDNDLNFIIEQMFRDMVGLRNIEHLELSMFSTLKDKIWNCQIPVGLFCNLKSLLVDECLNMSIAIPSNVFFYFKNLERLDIRNCDSLNHVFDLEGLSADVRTSKKSHQEILGFSSLKLLKVDNCNNLRYIFTPSIILGLVQLQEIEISNCALIEEIITRERAEDAAIDKIIIPLLSSIIFESLPNLTSMYSGSSILECPPLETMIIKNCQSIFRKDLSINSGSLSRGKVALPTLYGLTLSSIISEWKWHHQLPAATTCFQNLTILIIGDCDHLKYLFSSSMVNSLVRLEVLEICSCKFIEEIIVEEEEKRIGNILFPNLNTLNLFDLKRLTKFCNSAGDFIELFSLSQLWIKNCPSMKTFISNSKCGDMRSSQEPEEINSKENLHSTQMQPLFDKKVRLPSLEVLIFEHMDRLEKIWDDQLSLDFFCKLSRLDVMFCNKLVNIFSSNMLGIHQTLEQLAVVSCDSVEAIFEVHQKSSCKVEEIFVKKEAGSKIVFPNLTELHLKMLPNLRKLYPIRRKLEFPLLYRLKVYGCDKIEIFASQLLSHQQIHENHQQEISNQPSLLLVDEDSFPSLEKLHLGRNDIINEIWHGKILEYSRNIKVLKLKHFSEEVAILPSCFVHKLSNLEKLVVSDASFKEIFSWEESCSDGKHAEAFSKLRELKLSRLPELLSLWKENPPSCQVHQNLATLVVSECDNLKNLVPSSVSFENLTILGVLRCDSLINLMTLSTAKSLVRLTKMSLIDCKMIQEIFVEHVGDEMEEHQICFSQLKHLELCCLPSLTSFCLVNCSLEFPSLQQVIVSQCSKMKFFSEGVSNTPKLERVQMTKGKDDGCWEGNLNSTIKQSFKENDCAEF